MTKFIQHKFTVFVMFMLAVGSMAALAYVTVSATDTSAAGKTVPEMTVGNLKAEFVPFPAAPGLETVTISYSGAGLIDISKWELLDDDGVVAVVPSSTVLTSGDRIKLCATGSVITGCVDSWVGDVWANETGSFYMRAPEAMSNFISFSYENNENSVVLVPQREIVATVYEAQDQVPVCHLFKNGSYKTQKDQASRIVDAQRGHVTHEGDVVPSFFYNFGTGIGYFPGVTPEGVAIHPDTDCQ